jgi:tetratricopeptide (TPR) repeat protein
MSVPEDRAIKLSTKHALLVLIAAGLFLLWALGSINLASLAWSHRLLDNQRPPNFPDVVLKDNVARASESELGRLALSSAINPLFAFEPWRQRSMYALNQGHSVEAVEHLRRALALANQENRRMIYESFVVYGDNARSTSRDDQAALAFQILVDVAPQRSTAYVRLGELLRSQGRYEEAISLFSRAVAADDKEPDAHIERARAYHWMGVLHEGLGNREAALSAHRNAVNEDPANEGWYWAWNSCMALGRDAQLRGEWQEALDWFRRALELAAVPEQVALAQEELQKLQP